MCFIYTSFLSCFYHPGAGFGENGFTFEETNNIMLYFPIPKVNTTGEGPDVELWVLPDMTFVPQNKLVKITWRAEATIPQAYNSRTYTDSLIWDTNEDCVCFNLSILSRKISKILQKKNHNETNMTLEVNLVRIEEVESQQDDSSFDPFHQDLCAALATRETNDSFLVIKNYDEEYIREEFATNPTPINKRSVAQLSLTNISDVSLPERKIEKGCSVKSLIVNLTEVYGEFMKAPIITDVRDCSGRCTLLHDSSMFTRHGEIKERLKFLPGGEALSNYEPSCMPIKFNPLLVLIGLQPKSEVIVQMLDVVVDTCICQ